MSPTDTPIALASIAARSPAPPAPITSTSWECVSYFVSAILILVFLEREAWSLERRPDQMNRTSVIAPEATDRM